jgi:hypothetical protein
MKNYGDNVIFNEPIGKKKYGRNKRGSKTPMALMSLLPNVQLEFNNNAFTPNENINRSQFHKYSRYIKRLDDPKKS